MNLPVTQQRRSLKSRVRSKNNVSVVNLTLTSSYDPPSEFRLPLQTACAYESQILTNFQERQYKNKQRSINQESLTQFK